jgi:hypothetical protein
MKTFSCKAASIPKTRWAAYAAAGAATALGGTPSPAEAEIHYSGFVHHNFERGPFTAPLDPRVHLQLSVGTGTGVGNSSDFFGAIRILTPAHDSIGDFAGTRLSYTGFYVLELPAGVSVSAQPIGNYCRFYSTCECFDCFGGYIGGAGRFRDRGTSFIGFAFSRGAGVQYGWARVKKTGAPDYGFVLLDYAWGDVGDSIRTGQTSSSGDPVNAVTDSGSVGLLALGAAGLVAWRKRGDRGHNKRRLVTSG